MSEGKKRPIQDEQWKRQTNEEPLTAQTIENESSSNRANKSKRLTKVMQTILALAIACVLFLSGSLYVAITLRENEDESGKLYSYAVLSDVHMYSNDDNKNDGVVSDTEKGYRESVGDFDRAIKRMNALDPEFAFITGDVGYYGYLDELTLYQKAIKNAEIEYYPVRGNHDTGFSDSQWLEYTGREENFELVKGNDVFLGVSMYESGSTADTLDAPFGENATWLQDKLNEHKGKRIFVFMHLPMPDGAGLLDGHSEYDAYGFTSDSEEAAAIMNALTETDNVTVFSGHTHFEFAVEARYPIVNVYAVENKNVNLVHVPSCAYPRNSKGNEVQSKSQCYIVDVYAEKVVLRGFDLVTGKYMKDYVYTLYNSSLL